MPRDHWQSLPMRNSSFLALIILIVLLVASFTQNTALAKTEQTLGLSQFLDQAYRKAKIEQLSTNAEKTAELETNVELAIPATQFQFGGGSFQTEDLKGPYLEFMISQPLPWTVERSRIRNQREARLKSARSGAIKQTVEKKAAILGALLNHFALQERLEHVQERVARASVLRNYLKFKRTQSAQDRLDKVLLETRLKEVELEVLTVEDHFQISSDQIAHLADSKTSIGIAKTRIPIQLWVETLNREIESRSQLNSDRQVDENMADAELRAASLSWIPDLSLYYYQNQQNPRQFEITQSFGLTFSFPIWGLSDRKELAQLKASTKQLEWTQKDLDLKQAILKFESALKSFERTESQFSDEDIHRLEKDLASATNAFKLGQVNATSLLELEDRIHLLLQQKQNLKSDLFAAMTSLALLLKFDFMQMELAQSGTESKK